MARAIIKLMEVATVLLNSADWINTDAELYHYIAARLNEIEYRLRTVRE